MGNEQKLKKINEEQKSPVFLIVSGVLLVTVLAVVFVLPKSIDLTEEKIVDLRAETESTLSQENSPLAQAEQRQARAEAQNIIGQILPLRDSLLELQVERWASGEFDAALSSLETGERLYARGNYAESLNAYSLALENLKQIDASIPGRIQSNMVTAEKALEELRADTALSAFEVVLLLDPKNASAMQGLARAKALPAALPLWQQASIDIENQDWQKANTTLQQLVEIDPNFPNANNSLQLVKTKLLEQDFVSKMSFGFQALSEARLDAANSAFEGALALKPGNQEALDGLSQVKTEQINRAIASQLDEARTHERNEKWNDAVAIYDSMLKKYPGLAEVKAARLPAKVRAGIDLAYGNVMDAPLKLSTNETHRRAKQLLSDMESISNPGPKLVAQKEQLSAAILRSKTPVEITLLSDNLTNVEIFRIGSFGTLTRKTLALTPGQYVAAGNRSGYRDVQVRFTINGLDKNEPIEVICSEPI